jgi:hypothetical protein
LYSISKHPRRHEEPQQRRQGGVTLV